MLTIERLKKMKSYSVFAGGFGIEPMLSSKEIRWVAKRGGIHDWAIYYLYSDKSEEYIEENGDKVTSEEVIRRLVNCDDEAFGMYRY